MSKLNGWMRLYVVIVILSFMVAFIGIFIGIRQALNDPDRRPDYRVIAAIENPSCINPDTIDFLNHYCSSLNFYREIYPDAQLRTREEYIAHLELTEQREFLSAIGRVFMVWLGGVVLLYCFGLTGAWVMKGRFSSN